MPGRNKNNGQPASPMMVAALAVTLLFATGVLLMRLMTPSADAPAIEAETVAAVETSEEVWRETTDDLTEIQEWANKVEANPDNYYNYYRRGQAYYNDGAYDDASVDFTTAISLSVDHANSYLYRCYTYNELDYFDRALEDCQTVLEIDPDSASAYNSKGIAHYGLEDYDAALQAYSNALDINPDYTYALNNRGLVHLIQENYNAAIADYTASLESGNSNPYIPYDNRGDAYYELGQYRNAIADFDAAIADNPDYAVSYLTRGLAYEQLENHDAAVKDYYGWITRMTNVQSDYRYTQNGVAQTFTMTEGHLYNISYTGT
ncbi:MAG: tetratricopeptide repeat protein, partial [Aggregatilineales bacterium]